MIDRIRNTSESLLGLLLLLPAIIPLIFWGELLYPMMTIKTLLFRSGGILLLAVFLILLFSGRKFFFSRIKNPITWIPGMLLFVAYVSSFLGVDFYHSFWSTFERGDGLLTLTVLNVFFYVGLISVEKTFLRRLTAVVSWTAIIVGIIGVLQWIEVMLGIDLPLVLETQGRIGSTIGNAAFLAGYLGMTLFITIEHALSKTGRLRTILFAGAGVQLLAIIGTATRGTILALIVAVGLTFIYFAFRAKEKRFRMISRAVIVAGLIFAALFVQFRAEIAKIPFEPVQRIAKISTEDATVQSRLFLWSNLSQVGLENPVLGVGAGQVTTLFNRVYDPGLIVEQWFDRAHNSFLDYFLQYGVLGLLLYIGLLFAMLREAFRMWKQENTKGLLFGLLVITYIVQNIFVFDTAVTLWLLFAVFMLLRINNSNSEEQTNVLSPGVGSIFLPAGIILLALIGLYFVSYKPFLANWALAQGYKYHLVDVDRTTNAFMNGLEKNTFADLEYGYQLYDMYTDRQQHMLEGDDLITAYALTRKVLLENFDQYSYDARTGTYLAHVLDVAPRDDLVEEEKLQEVLDQIMALSPKRQQAWYIAANIPLYKADRASSEAERRAFYTEAVGILEEYVVLSPQIAEPYFILGTLYLRLGDVDKARARVEEGTQYYRKDSDVAIRGAEFYLFLEDWSKARFFLEDYVTANPQDYAVMFDLAKIRLIDGDPQGAQDIIDLLKEEQPQILETDQAFVQSVQEEL